MPRTLPRSSRVFTGGLGFACLLAACGRDTTDPVPPPPTVVPAALRVTLPDTVVAGQAFSLTVAALGPDAQVLTGWIGTVTLSSSAGQLSPSSVAVTQGTSTVRATLNGAAGSVNVTAQVGGLIASVPTLAMSGAQAVRLEVVPAAFLLTAQGESATLRVRALDATGAPTLPGPVTWRSLNPGTLTVDASGRVTAAGPLGSGQIVVESGTMISAPALGLIAEPAQGALLVDDDQVMGDPVEVNPLAPYEYGWRYRVRLRDASPTVGQIVVGTGEIALGGRVVAVAPAGQDLADVTLELIPLDELFGRLRINERLSLANAPVTELVGAAAGSGSSLSLGGAPQLSAVDFTIGPFDCKADVSAPLQISGLTFTVTPSLSVVLDWNESFERLIVDGQIKATLKGEPKLTAAFEGKVVCSKDLFQITLPIGGPIALIFGGHVPLGVGLEVSGKLSVANVGLKAEATAIAQGRIGVDCTAGCQMVNEFTSDLSGKFEPILPDPSQQFKVELRVYPHGFAKLQIGNRWLRRLRFESFKVTAGPAQLLDLSLMGVQAENPGYHSTFRLRGLLTAGAGSSVAVLEKLLRISFAKAELKVETDLAHSPKGTFTIAPATVRAGTDEDPGDMATFRVTLDPVTYLSLYAVDRIDIKWAKPDSTGGFTLENGRPSCSHIPVTSSGQTVFQCETHFLEEHVGDQQFFAFVHSKLFGIPLPVPLEVAPDGSATVCVTAPLYVSDFLGTAGPEWSHQIISTAPSGERYLGDFQRETLTLRLEALPEHSKIAIAFDFYTVSDWEGSASPDRGGPDIMTFRIADQTALVTTFSTKTGFNQAYPGSYPGTFNPPLSGASAIGALGYEGASDRPGDATYRISFTVPHTADEITLEIVGGVTAPEPSGERWGIDNVRVTIPECEAPTTVFARTRR